MTRNLKNAGNCRLTVRIYWTIFKPWELPECWHVKTPGRYEAFLTRPMKCNRCKNYLKKGSFAVIYGNHFLTFHTSCEEKNDRMIGPLKKRGTQVIARRASLALIAERARPELMSSLARRSRPAG